MQTHDPDTPVRVIFAHSSLKSRPPYVPSGVTFCVPSPRVVAIALPFHRFPSPVGGQPEDWTCLRHITW